MEANQVSVLQEKARGTYNRNKEIRRLARDGHNFAQIARRYSLTRQAIRAIVVKQFREV